MGLPRKNIFWRPCLWRMSQAMNVYSLRTSCTISPPRPHEKKRRGKMIYDQECHTQISFFLLLWIKKVSSFSLQLSFQYIIGEPHDSVFYWLYRFGWFFNMYLTKSISLGGTFSLKKIMRNSKCRQYCFGRELGSCHFTNCVLD